jgi:phosphomannomutase
MSSLSKSYHLDPTVLREYDIRGVVGQTLTVEGVRAIGQAFGTIVVRKGGTVVAVGYDGRLSSPELEVALVEGLASTGLTVYRVGLGPSPMLYFAIHHLSTDAGMMLTGSHNPPEYNGIKISLQGHPFFGQDIQDLSKIAAAGDFESGSGTVLDRPIAEAYVDRLVQDFQPVKELSVAWDPGNGATGEIVQALCDKLPGRHVLINETIDGHFPAHHPDPTVEENLEQLKQLVAEEGCDLGIGLDGDGDRIGVIDSRGRVLWGDQLLVILAGPVLAELPGSTIIADVKASQVFFDEIERMGGQPLMSRTGHSLIKNLMVETGAPLAGEMSGHIFFAHNYYGYDDALYSAVRLLSIVSGAKIGLSEMRDALPKMVNTPELRFDCPEDRKFLVVEEVRDRLKSMKGIRIGDIDGVRVSNADGWWLLRASNTGPVLVGRCEAADEASLSRLVAELNRQLSLSGLEQPIQSH